jgi:multicomponent Na+:H+ antiporter subunit D
MTWTATWTAALPWLIVLSSLVPGVLIFFVAEENRRLRSSLNLAGAVAKVVLVAVALYQVYHGATFVWRAELLPGTQMILRLDPLGLLFVALSGGLWLVTTVYAIGYMEEQPHRSRFFGFFSLCVTATVGIAQAGNLFTLFLFYELLTLSTYPLIVHDGTREARRVGRMYLAYTLGGSTLVLAGAIWLQVAAGPVPFAEAEGTPGLAAEVSRGALTAIFALLVVGFAVKAAVVPLHAWLPAAMVAPTPVSALLHAVAVVKAGAFGIIRVVYDVFGFALVDALDLAGPLAVAAVVTILYGSLQALRQENLKRRLAYSTVSQVSYIVLGTALAGSTAAMGGMVHLVHQGVMKITLFFCAGSLAETLGVHDIRELRGAGRRMPVTMATFTVAALGMMAAPPMAGFITEWYLGFGALQAGQGWVLGVLLTSSLLNAMYFLPIVYDAWFREPPPEWPEERDLHPGWETRPSLLLPGVVTAVLTVAFGLFAGTPFAPLEWVQIIALREFPP